MKKLNWRSGIIQPIQEVVTRVFEEKVAVGEADDTLYDIIKIGSRLSGRGVKPNKF